MFDFVLALARILVDIPCIAVSNGEDDEVLDLDIRDIERRYECLSDVDKRQVAEYWQVFQTIADRQNELHRRAVELNRELIGHIGRELASRDSTQELEIDEEDRPEASLASLRELCRLARQLPSGSLVDLVAFARNLVDAAQAYRLGGGDRLPR